MKISIAEAPGEQRTKGAGVGTDDAEAGLVPVRAPSQGVFYRRPSPDSPAYVEEGSEVSTGTVLGLVEVMKTFAQVLYRPGGSLPARARVLRVAADDGADVDEGDALLELEPA